MYACVCVCASTTTPRFDSHDLSSSFFLRTRRAKSAVTNSTCRGNSWRREPFCHPRQIEISDALSLPFSPFTLSFPPSPSSFRSFPFHLLSSASGAFVSEDISESLGQIDIPAFKVDRIPILMLARAIRSVLYTLVLYKLKRNHRSHQFSNLRVFHRSFETRYYYLTSRFYRQLFLEA